MAVYSSHKRFQGDRMFVRNSLFGFALLGLAAAVGPAQAANVDARSILKQFNNIVLNDLTTGSGHTHGSLYVGGDYNGGGVVNMDNNPNGQLTDDISGSMIVGGNVNGQNQIHLHGGNARIGGIVTSGTIETHNGATVETGTPGIPASDIMTAFQSLSTELFGMADTGGVANTSDQNDINFQSGAGVNGVAVFHVDASDIDAGTFKGVFAPAGVTTVINVAGTSATLGMNAGGFGATPNQSVIFNFYEATTLTLNSMATFSVLAPFANVLLQSDIKGTLVSNNLDQRAQVITPYYDGNIPLSTVPVPAAAFLLLTGIAAIGGMAARRRRA